jgi:hypothetical protein
MLQGDGQCKRSTSLEPMGRRGHESGTQPHTRALQLGCSSMKTESQQYCRPLLCKSKRPASVEPMGCHMQNEGLSQTTKH